MSKAIALITATNEVVQSPESVGTLWKTLSARIRGAKTELEELGEEEDEFTKTTSKLRDLVKSLTGFDIMVDEDTYKDIYEIILGIGEAWDSLSDIEQASLGEALAGKRNYNALMAVMGNLDTLQEAYKAAQEAEESAAREQENYAKSVQYSIDRINASLEELSYDFLNSQFLKNAIELGNDFIRVLDEIVEHTDALIDTFVLLGAYLGIKFRKQISGVASDAIMAIKEIGAEALRTGKVSMEMSSLQAGITSLTTSFGPLAVAIGLVTAAVVIGAKAWDEYQTSVEEWNQKISETESKISSLRSEIEQLQKIDYRTQEEQERLDLLEKQLTSQERLLEVEKKRANLQKYGTETPAQLWDKNNATNVWDNYLTERIQSWGFNSNYDYSKHNGQTFDLVNINEATSKIEEYNKQLKNITVGTEDYVKVSKEKEDAEQDAIDSYEKLLIQTEEYRQELQAAEEAQKGFEKGSNAYESAESLIQSYSEWIAENEAAIRNFEKLTGRFDYSSIISSMFQHTEFDGLQDQLVKLAKEGGLSVDYLTEHFSGPGGLLEKLDLAGVDAEVLYQWLLRISGLVDTHNLAQRIAGSDTFYDDKGFRGKAGIIEDYLNSIPEEDRQLVAGLDIDWSTFNADEAIAKMQREIEKSKNNPVSVEVKSTIADSVSGISTRLKAQFDELGTLYDKIFNGEEGFDLSEIDNSDLQGIVDNFTKFNEELGLTAEEQEHVKEVAEDFMRVLTNEKSTSDQVQQAFNDLATTYFYDADGLKELNAKTADAIEQQLEQMGVVNAHKVVQEQLNVQLEVQKNKAEAIAAANSDMEGTTKDASAEFWREANMAYAARVELANVVATTRILGNEDLDLSQQRDELKQLAAEAMGAAAALELERLIDDVDGAGLSLEEAWGQIYNKFKTLPELEINLPDVDGGASGAGKDAADEYVEAFEKELEALEKQRDAGIISESEFLDKYRELIERYFKDVDGYGEEYAERMADYWDKLISHMENVVSAIGKLLDKKKEAAEKGKESAVSALEEEKEAAEKYYQDQIDYIDGLIDALEDEKDALQDQIDVLNEQIEAINEANTAREHSMALQRAEYELQRAMSQRTSLVYTGEVGQMRYERDEKTVRSSQESVKEAEDQLAIDAIEKQIKLLEKQQELIDNQIDAYKDQQEALQGMLDASNEYYENLISETEEYWDSLIDAIDNQKSKWEELVEQKEIAEAFALVQDAMRALGYTVDDVLNDTPGAFEAFRDAYLQALTDANANNQDFLDGLNYATSGAKTAFGEISSSAGEIESALGKVADATAPLSTAASNIEAVGKAASTASTEVGKLKDACPSECIDNLNNANFNGLETAIDGVKTKLEDITKLLTGPEGSIQSALDKLNDPTVLEQLGNAFTELSSSITQVATALGVGGGGGNGEQDATESSSRSMSEGATEGGAGLAKAIESIKTAADEFIGTSVDDYGETTIGRFNLLKSAIQTLVDEVIGNTEIEGTLIGSINSLPQVTDTALNGDEGAISMFNKFSEAINACATAASSLLEKLKEMEGINLPSFDGGEDTEHNFQGTAKLNGDWRVGKDEKSLVGELGPELVVDSKKGKYRLVGQRGPEITKLHAGDIVFNHLQTKEILSKKNQIRAFADGTVLSPLSSSALNLQGKIQQGFRNAIPDLEGIQKIIKQQTTDLSSVIQKNNTPNITVTNPQFTVTGVNGEQVMRQIEGAFEGLMLNAYQKALSGNI